MKRLVVAACLSLAVIACSKGTFDSQTWKEADLLSRSRVEMMPALLRQHELVGMSREEVVNLLGDPTQTDKWQGWDMIYVLGPTDYMPIDNEWLLLRLDRSQRVAAFKQTAD